MRLRHRLTLGFVAVLAVVALIVLATPGGADQPSATHHKTTTFVPSSLTNDRTLEALGKVVLAEQYATMYWAQVAQYATEYNRQQVVAWIAAHTPRPVVHNTIHSTPSYSGGGGPVGACGGATNGADRFIHRESGGDPTILNGGAHASSPYNGSGRAFGCYQIMPGTWSGSCSDITTYDPASQARCASRLPQSAWGG